jgi:hypothetical protein
MKIRVRHGIHTIHWEAAGCIKGGQQLFPQDVREFQQPGILGQRVRREQAAQVSDNDLEEVGVLPLLRISMKNPGNAAKDIPASC